MKFSLRYILFVLFFSGGWGCIIAQHEVQGKILDKITGQPVPFTIVYLPDVSKATLANDSGHFELKNLPGVNQKFTFSCIGYKPVSFTLVFSDSTKYITVILEPEAHEGEEVIINGTQINSPDQSSGSITSLSQRVMRSKGALSISDGVAKLPGVSQLSTGAGISKPVIRGMYGNRIQTVVMGMRFDNQQWQDEHGLGLQDIGVDRVEVIKGPAALMYGSEAMGGVINIIEEKPANIDSVQGDASLRLFSNTFGAGIDGGVLAAKQNHFYRIRIGAESHADYSDGANTRVVNSRFDGYVGKATFGYNKKNWVSVNNYLFSKSDFGFLMDAYAALNGGERMARDLSNPHHTVFINLFTSQNTFFGKKGNIFRLNGGVHINRRMEDEGGGGISLDMQLITYALHFQLEHSINEHWILMNGIQSQYQQNKNYGFRKIVPDANLAEGSLYAYLKRTTDRFVFEAGLRFDGRQIKTFETGIINTGLYDISTINKFYHVANGSVGTSIQLIEDLHFKANITTGYRTPNLAELSSNGVHEGTFRYEIGNPQMKIEQNFCAEAGFTYENKNFSFSVTAYNNRFLNYVYLQPTTEEFFGFTIYRYLQTNATLQGGEATIDWSPEKTEWLDLSASYSTIRAKTDAGNYLPFIPADKVDESIKLELGDYKKWKDIYFRVGSQYYFPQNHPGQFETSTSDYLLLDAGLGSTIKLNRGKTVDLDICGNNLLNKKYYDHLSRYKEYGIYNIGRNICVNLKYEW